MSSTVKYKSSLPRVIALAPINQFIRIVANLTFLKSHYSESVFIAFEGECVN